MVTQAVQSAQFRKPLLTHVYRRNHPASSWARAVAVAFLCWLSVTTATAQVRISGTITSADIGVGLAATHVRIAGTSTGAISNQQGQFVIVVPQLPVTIEFRYIGYQTQLITFGPNSSRNVSVVLEPAVVVLEEIVVSGVDRAERIMREVVRRKRILHDTLSASKATAYSRITLSTSGQLQLIRESVWDEFYSARRGRRNVIRSFRETSELYKAFDIVPARTLLNFYDDTIEINGLSFVGPTHPNGEQTYEFSLGGTRMIDSLRAFEIFVAPKSAIKPSFIGTITVVDSIFTLAEIDLRPARHVEFQNGFDNWAVAYNQHFAAIEGDVWFPIDLSAEGRISRTTRGEEYLSARFEQYARIGEYELNTILPDDPFRDESVIQIDSVAVFQDYLFMRGYNIIPMTPREEDAFYKLRNDPNRLTSVFRERRQFDVLGHIRPRTYRRDGPQFVFPTIRGYVPSFRYNRVDGFVSGIGQGGSLTDRTRLAYGVAQSTGAGGIRYNLEVEQGIGELKNGGSTTSIGFRVNRDTEAIVASPIYSTEIASLPSIAGRGDYFDYYWSRQVSIEINKRWDAVRLKLVGYRDRDEPREQEVGRSWPWATNYRHNPAITDSSIAGLIFRIHAGDTFEPYHSRSRSFVAEVEQGLGTSFTRVRAGVDFSVETLYRSTIRPNRLDVRIIAGILIGNDAPLQRLGGLDGSLLGFGTLGVFRSLRDRQDVGDRWVALFADHDFGSVLFDRLGMTILSETKTGLRLFGSVGIADIRSSNRPAGEVYGFDTTTRAEAGLSLSNILGSGIRIDAGSRLDQTGLFVGFGFGRR